MGCVMDVDTDVVICNDVNALPICMALKENTGVKLVLDLHEYAVDDSPLNVYHQKYISPMWDYFLKKHLMEVDAFMTVCNAISDRYFTEYGRESVVVTNAPAYEDFSPTPVNGDQIRMIHHGGAMRGRGIENMIHLMDGLGEKFHLTLMLVSNSRSYLRELKSLAAVKPNVTIIDPVPTREISAKINPYDIGLYMLPANCLNNEYALPNKFFEFIQGRLAICVWPSREMAHIINQEGCGKCSEDFTPESMRVMLNSLDNQQIETMKAESHRLASKLCFEKNAVILREILAEVLEK